jgi:hypothetical protein|tara:strand:- start:545 stop:775 length:231 start_codon:yes stop_codon:yes gene_type:complete
MYKQIAPALVVALLLGNVNETKALQLDNKVELDEWMNSYDDLLAQLEDPEDLDDELEVAISSGESEEEEIQLGAEE